MFIIKRFRSNLTDVTVIRSVSDAIEPSNKYCSSSRRSNNGFLRKPEVLETVYSFEEDVDAASEPNSKDNGDNSQQSKFSTCGSSNNSSNSSNSSTSSSTKPKLRDLYGSFERLVQQQEDNEECNGTTPLTKNTPNQRITTKDESQVN